MAKTLTVDAVNTLLADYLTSVFQWEAGRVVVETQAGPRPPSGVYATLWWKGQELLQQGMGDFTLPESPEDEGVQSLGNETLCTVQVSVRGPHAYSLASEARYGLEAAERFFDLWRVLGFAGCGPVTDLSGPLGGRIQQRAFFDITFYALFGRPTRWSGSTPHSGPSTTNPCNFPGGSPMPVSPVVCPKDPLSRDLDVSVSISVPSRRSPRI
ncbi:MAG: hypothetical protein ACLR7Z_17285 [Bilophila wadsworthia]